MDTGTDQRIRAPRAGADLRQSSTVVITANKTNTKQAYMPEWVNAADVSELLPGQSVVVDVDDFTDIIGRNFKQPKEGLGFDDSPVAHMWRTMIWPNNFL